VIALESVRFGYGATDALSLERWSVGEGAHCLVTGPSGCGKTTLLHLLAGILRPRTGRVTVAGQDLGALAPDALDRFRGRHIGVVLQRLHLVASLTLLGNLLLAQYCAGVARDAPRALEVLESLGIAAKARARPHELSHGQAQRVAVARAVINRPRVLLADEPTSNLDDAHCAQTIELLVSQARACGATLVIATHDQRLKSRIAERLELAATG